MLQFKRGDAVIYTDRQGATLTTVVRRVVIIQGATRRIRYYALDGLGVLTADGLEVA